MKGAAKQSWKLTINLGPLNKYNECMLYIHACFGSTDQLVHVLVFSGIPLKRKRFKHSSNEKVFII